MSVEALERTFEGNIGGAPGETEKGMYKLPFRFDPDCLPVRAACHPRACRGSRREGE